MRLIGGNISDTPVKEVGDGSAFNVGGGAAWWQSRLDAAGDANWDDVVALMQVHPDDVIEAKETTDAFTPDRKDASRNWNLKRHTSTSASRNSWTYAEFELDDIFPLGASWFCQTANALISSDNFTAFDWDQDWTMECIHNKATDTDALDPSSVSCALMGISNSGHSYHFGYWASYSRQGTGHYFYANGATPGNVNHALSLTNPDAAADNMASLNPSHAHGGPRHTAFTYDASANVLRMWLNGVQATGGGKTIDLGGMSNTNNLGFYLGGYMANSVSLAGVASQGPVQGGISGFRLSTGDRFGVKADTGAGFPAQFNPPAFFPEQGT